MTFVNFLFYFLRQDFRVEPIVVIKGLPSSYHSSLLKHIRKKDRYLVMISVQKLVLVNLTLLILMQMKVRYKS